MKRWVFMLILAGTAWTAGAQRIVYSDYDREDSRRMEFDIAGKLDGNFLIYKNTRNRHWIVLYDNEMRQVDKVEQDYVPNNDKVINIDFFQYPGFIYMIYQYQRKNIVYCMASRIDGTGNRIGEVVELDTSHIGATANNRIYTAINSEDKSRISVFKINSRNRKLYRMTTLLYNDKLDLLKRSDLEIPMEERNENLGDFTLDNDGDMAFCRFFRNNNDNITRASLVVKYAMADTLQTENLEIEKTLLDEIHIKADNANKRYFLMSLYYKERKGSIEGFFFHQWDKRSGRPLYTGTFPFSDELRREAKGEATVKMAFDDYFIRHIILRRDGGFIIGSEAFYTTSRFNNWNRWNYLYSSPFYSSYYNFNNPYYSPYFNNSYWNNRFGNNQSVRYHADNITVFSFSGEGKLEWSNVLGKNQFGDESDDFVSYQLLNTGDQLHFLFNLQERRNSLLTDYSISPSGELIRNPTLKNLDRGYEFMPKYGKQVSARQMIIPCIYRSYICFAKIDYGQN